MFICKNTRRVLSFHVIDSFVLEQTYFNSTIESTPLSRFTRQFIAPLKISMYKCSLTV